jgi:predicted AAA+ superfamily ATPase
MNESMHIQTEVTRELNEPNEQRELTRLLSVLKTFKQKTGLILTYDQEDEKIIEGKKIIIKPVWKWLLESMADE